MRCGKPLWGKAFALGPRAHRRKRHRHKRRAKCRCARLGDCPPRRIGQNRQGRHVRAFALICRHALSGVALHMLNRLVIFLRGEFDIFDCHVILEIEPRALGPRNGPQRRDIIRRIFGPRQINRWRGCTDRLDHLHRGRMPIDQRLMGREMSSCRPDRNHIGHHIGRGHKALRALIPTGPPIHMTGQMHRRVPPATHRDKICIHFADRATCILNTGRAQAQTPRRVRNRSPRSKETVWGDPLSIWTGIDDCGDFNTRRLEIAHGAGHITCIAINNSLAPRRDAVPV